MTRSLAPIDLQTGLLKTVLRARICSRTEGTLTLNLWLEGPLRWLLVIAFAFAIGF